MKFVRARLRFEEDTIFVRHWQKNLVPYRFTRCWDCGEIMLGVERLTKPMKWSAGIMYTTLVCQHCGYWKIIVE